MRWMKNRGVITKITWMIAVVLIIPTAVVGIFYYNSYKKTLLKDAGIQMESWKGLRPPWTTTWMPYTP